MPDDRIMCRACGGSGRAYGNEDAPWCATCGGVGHVPAGALAPGGAGGGTGVGVLGTLQGLGSLLFLLALVAVPVVALVVVLDWFVVLGGPLRSTFEALPGSAGVVTAPGGDGSPATVTVVAALLVLVGLVAVAVAHRRAVRSTRSSADVWRARGWGLLLGVVVLAGLPFVVTVWAVGSGLDLERPETVPTLTHVGFVVLVGVLLVLFAWLVTGRRYLVEHRRALRRG